MCYLRWAIVLLFGQGGLIKTHCHHKFSVLFALCLQSFVLFSFITVTSSVSGERQDYTHSRSNLNQESLDIPDDYDISIPRLLTKHGTAVALEEDCYVSQKPRSTRSKRSAPDIELQQAAPVLNPEVETDQVIHDLSWWEAFWDNQQSHSDQEDQPEDSANELPGQNDYPWLSGGDDSTRIYELDAFGEHFQLELDPYSDFIGDHTVVQHIDDNQTWIEGPDTVRNLKRCFYRGRVRGDPSSTVTLSACHSLLGSWHAFGTHYMIEPHPDDASLDDHVGGKRHLVYRPTSVPLPGGRHGGAQTDEQGAHTSAAENNTQDNSTSQHNAVKETCHVTRDSSSFISPVLSPIPDQHSSSHPPSSGFVSQLSSFISSFSSSVQSDTHTGSNKHRHGHHPADHPHRLQDGSGSSSSRSRRSVSSFSRQHYTEVMVVADSSMYNYHKNNIHHYLFTLMSVVASIYRSPTVGNAISIEIVKMEILHNDREFRASSDAVHTLQSFCDYQYRKNEQDDVHHDTAVLITRHNLCRQQGGTKKCDTLGLAELGTMCVQHKSCSLVEDNGLSAAFTVAHELGHVFSLAHDDTPGCNRINRPGEFYVMTATLDHNTDPWSWSECSRRTMTSFLSAGDSECLLNQPSRSRNGRKHIGKNRLPGEYYDADKQCRLIYGPQSNICTYMTKCGRLWCTSPGDGDDRCRTQHMPWADGSQCADQRWCFHGRCQPARLPTPQQGVWSDWSAWGPCSRSCGGGIKAQKRWCNNPEPTNGGKFCLGKRINYKSCNTQDCPGNPIDFRAQQCRQFNGNTFNIKGLRRNVKWTPKYAGIQKKDLCRLFCRVVHSSAFYRLSTKVIDGTKCSKYTSDICVHGKCQPAGCDNDLESSKKRDRCGVCGGDNTSCRIESGRFQHVQYGYNTVVTIPSGATDIVIQQSSQGEGKDDNYLAIRNGNNTFLLNGGFVLNVFPIELEIKGGAILNYYGATTHREMITCTDTTEEEIEILVLAVGNLQNPNIQYQYTVSLNTIDSIELYTWMYTECNRKCHGMKSSICVRTDNNETVSDMYCASQNPGPARCNRHCELNWRAVSETACSSQCGEGEIVTTYKCVLNEKHASVSYFVRNEHCEKAEPKPHGRRGCRVLCTVYWNYGPWGSCSSTCGSGFQERSKRCVDIDGNQMADTYCDDASMPLRQSCNTQPCPHWNTEDWGPCSVSCGVGTQQRHVFCQSEEETLSDDLCSEDQPIRTQECRRNTCASWQTTYWTACSVTCGEGVQKRTITCVTDTGHSVRDSICAAHSTRPKDTHPCYKPPCVQITSPPTTVLVTTTQPVLDRPVKPASSQVTMNRLYSVQWRTGSWTQCSATCGFGTHERYVSCRDYNGKVADDSYCAGRPKPPYVEKCKVQSCGEWRTGAWTPCSVTCGSGRARRLVDCVSRDLPGNQVGGEVECDDGIRPLAERVCHIDMPCPHGSPGAENQETVSNQIPTNYEWISGAWGKCSNTCGEGWQMRRILCEHPGTGLEISGCDETNKPIDYQACNDGPCPQWNHGPWTECSLPCGSGTRERAVICQLPSGGITHNHQCDVMSRPINIQPCNTHSCVIDQSQHSHTSRSTMRTRNSRDHSNSAHTPHMQHYPPSLFIPTTVDPADSVTWDMGPWSKLDKSGSRKDPYYGYYSNSASQQTKETHVVCTAQCGVGVIHRSVTCVNNEGVQVYEGLCPGDPPLSEAPCTGEDCHLWKSSNWSQCSVTCGMGLIYREVWCSLNNETVTSEHCDNRTKPGASEMCHQHACPEYAWDKSSWSQCSQSCGQGVKSRHVWCSELTNQTKVASENCMISVRPRDKKRCKHQPCEALWVAKGWSECSSTCDPGIQVREVQCQPTTPEGWLLPVQVHTCNETLQPPTRRTCNMGNCTSPYRWAAEPWQQCSRSCGHGRARRRVNCVNSEGDRQPKSLCQLNTRPSVRKTCYNRHCYSPTCKHLKRTMAIHKDGEYRLLVLGHLLKIYCYNMHSKHPVEYLTLPAGGDTNFANMYPWRLLDPKTCPINRTEAIYHNESSIYDEQPCTECSTSLYSHAGQTNYTKVRLNVTTLQILGNDHTFTEKTGKRHIPYGTAGDCYSSVQCPQGIFSMDFRGTPFRLLSTTTWQNYGHNPTSQVSVSQTSQVIQGICGGYCGGCGPHPALGIRLEIFT